MRLGGIYVGIGARTSKLKRDLAKAKGMAAKTAVLMNREIGKISFKRVGIAALAFAATFGFAMKKLIDSASDLEETVSKFNVVFTGQVQQAEKHAKILVDSYAMSTREAKQYMSSVQDLLVPMGMVADKALDMSNEVVKLAADLGSFNNLPTAQVMLDIQSALVGNFETMKKYGVILNETVIKQKALEMGMWSGKGMVDANTKAQVAFTLMLKGSAAAIGDMERTSESYANQMKKFKANIEDIKAMLGEQLLPAITDIVQGMNEWIKANDTFMKQGAKDAIWELGIALDWVVGLYVKLTDQAGIFQAIKPMWDDLGGFKIGPATKGWLGYAKAMAAAARDQAEMKKGLATFNAEVEAAFANMGEAASLAYLPTLAYYNLIKDFGQIIPDISGKELMEIPAVDQDPTISNEQAIAEAKDRFRTIERQEATKQSEYLKALSKAERQQKLNDMRDTVSTMTNGFKMISEMGGKHSKKAFKLYKAFKITETLIATYDGAIKAFGAMAGIPYVGPALGVVAAAMVTAFGMAQVAMIRGATPPSYDLGGISTTPGMYYAGVPEAHIPLQSGKVPVEVKGGAPITNIYMDNPVFQDIATQRRVFAEIARQVAPAAVMQNYNDGLGIRNMVRSGA